MAGKEENRTIFAPTPVGNLDNFTLLRGYWEEVKRQCLQFYVEGNGFRRIEGLTLSVFITP
jgi:hypothetical protein